MGIWGITEGSWGVQVDKDFKKKVSGFYWLGFRVEGLGLGMLSKGFRGLVRVSGLGLGI